MATEPSVWAQLYPWIVSGIGGFIGAALLLPTKLGEAILKSRFDTLLEAYKAEQAQALEKLKSEHTHDLEKLKEQLNHIADRGRRSNEKEFLATSSIWEACVDAYQASTEAAVQFISHPDLNVMSAQELSEFLGSVDTLAERERTNIASASDKNKAFANTITFHSINTARQKLFDLRLLIRKQEIFTKPTLRPAIDKLHDALQKAVGEAYARHQFPNAQSGYKATIDLLSNGEKYLDDAMLAVRRELLRDSTLA